MSAERTAGPPPNRMLWDDRWIAVPAPHPVVGAALIEVELTAPVAALGPAHGRVLASPLRKALSFAVTDGPLAAARKITAKRAEGGMSGDYHLVLVRGHRAGERVVALAPRAPRCAALLLAPEALVRPAPEGFDRDRFAAAAAALGEEAPALAPHVRQSYLYSATEPPEELAAALDRALAAAAAGPTAPDAGPTALAASPTAPDAAPELLAPPAGRDEGSHSELLALSALPAHRPAERPGVGRLRYIAGRSARGGGTPSKRGGAPLALLGAGDYVRIEVAPALAAAALERTIVADREPQIAALAGAELGFAAATSNATAAIDALERRGVVLVATAHDSHAALAAQALDAGHRVLCEKPAIVTPADLDLLAAAADHHPGELEVGFNRRHHPLVERAHRLLGGEQGPTTIVAFIREVEISAEHWYLWPNQGTRVAGNLCHWIDLAFHLLGPGPRALAVSVSPRVSDDPRDADAERAFTITFDDGSVVTLVPTTRGDSVRGVQEQIDIRRGDLALRLDDLWLLRGLRRGVPVRHRTLWRGKGHARMYRRALERFAAGEPASYPAADLRRVGEVQLAATEAVRAERSGGEIGELLAAARTRDGG